MNENEGVWQETFHGAGKRESTIIFEHPFYGEIKLDVHNYRNRKNASVVHIIMRNPKIPLKPIHLDKTGFWLESIEESGEGEREAPTTIQRTLFKDTIARILRANPHSSKPLTMAIRRFVASHMLKYDPTPTWQRDRQQKTTTFVETIPGLRLQPHK
jgi:hypothetical protein